MDQPLRPAYASTMRFVRISLVGILVMTVTSMHASAGGTLTPEEARAAARAHVQEAIKLEKRAAEKIPYDFEGAKADLEAAASELEKARQLSFNEAFKNLTARAKNIDSDNAASIGAGGNVDSFELREAMALKYEARDLIDAVEFRATGKKKSNRGVLGRPACPDDGEENTAGTCYTVDTWRIFIDRDARAGFCLFRDDEGRRITNLRPLFDGVIQETSCRLLDSTVVVNGVRKAVLRGRLRLVVQEGSVPSGEEGVRIIGLWR